MKSQSVNNFCQLIQTLWKTFAMWSVLKATISFELLPNKGSIFFATIQGDSIKLDSVWGYDNRVFGKTLDYNSWRNETQPKSLPAFFNREQIKSDSSRYGVRLFSEFRQFIMTADGLDKNKFDEKFNMDDSLINLYNRMAFMNLFSHLDQKERQPVLFHPILRRKFLRSHN